MSRPTTIASLLVVLLSSACSTIEVEAHAVQITHKGIRFDAAPAALANVTFSASDAFELDTANVDWVKRLNASVDVDKVTLHASSGVTNLDFIQSAGVTVADTSRSQIPVQVMTYKRSTSASTGSDLQIVNDRPVDVTPAWSGDHVQVEVAVTGTLPTTSWSVDLSLWLSGRITY